MIYSLVAMRVQVDSDVQADPVIWPRMTSELKSDVNTVDIDARVMRTLDQKQIDVAHTERALIPPQSIRSPIQALVTWNAWS